MVEALELLARPALWAARALWWLGWDIGVRTVGWSIGWPIWRFATLGKFPEPGFRDIDVTADWAILVVDLTGLAVLAIVIWELNEFLHLW